MKHLHHSLNLDRAAVAALFCLLIAACGGKQRPSQSEINSLVQSSPEVKALTQRTGQEIVFDQEIEDELLYTQSFKHKVNGVEVMGSGVNFHFNQDAGNSLSSHIAEITLETDPKMSPLAAKELAEKYEAGKKVVTRPVLKILPAMQSRPARLIYIMGLETGEEIWIDAEDGAHIATLEESNNVNSKIEVRSAQEKGIVSIHLDQGDCAVTVLGQEEEKKYSRKSCQKVEENSCQVLNWDFLPVAFNHQACDPVTAEDPSAIRAKRNAEAFLDYFQRVHGRESYDGKGSPIVSIIHGGADYANASWFKKEKVLVYGDGDGRVYRDFTYALDVAAHELTHALIQSSARLVSFGESGALNESLADYFGEVIEGEEDWVLGKKLMVNPAAALAIRNLVNPAALLGQYRSQSSDYVTKSYPARMDQLAAISEPCREVNDYCGIHFNATVPGHSWFLIHQELGQSKAERLIYIALTHYFHELTDLKEAARLTLDACHSIYERSDCEKVEKVFQTTQML